MRRVVLNVAVAMVLVGGGYAIGRAQGAAPLKSGVVTAGADRRGRFRSRGASSRSTIGGPTSRDGRGAVRLSRPEARPGAAPAARARGRGVPVPGGRQRRPGSSTARRFPPRPATCSTRRPTTSTGSRTRGRSHSGSSWRSGERSRGARRAPRWGPAGCPTAAILRRTLRGARLGAPLKSGVVTAGADRGGRFRRVGRVPQALRRPDQRDGRRALRLSRFEAGRRAPSATPARRRRVPLPRRRQRRVVPERQDHSRQDGRRALHRAQRPARDQEHGQRSRFRFFVAKWRTK